MYFPSLDGFRSLLTRGNLIPVYREILADMDTPVSAFKKIDDGETSFLLESIEGGEKWGRFSFLGSGSSKIFCSKGEQFQIFENGQLIHSVTTSDPLEEFRRVQASFQAVEVDGLPRFFGGMVGYLGYDMVRFIEHLPSDKPKEVDTYDALFLLTEKLLIFDNVLQTIKIISNVHVDPEDEPEKLYRKALDDIEELARKLKNPVSRPVRPAVCETKTELTPNFSHSEFLAAVETCKEYVRSGDVIQVVLSQRFSGPLSADPFDVYRILRTLNPSPYMYFLRLPDIFIIGASPEVMVRKEGRKVEVRPIAGTRPRGKTAAEDLALEEELLADPKELAEHIMLVDLGRNDLGRVCETGSVEVNELMFIERYSHVMHIVSNVQGKLEEGKDAVDAFRAVFPAGTLSGAPKIRAMEIIDELEPCKREVYGGAVGYFSYTGNMDMAIAIRTLIVKDGQVYVQAGAGIVADSQPEAEYQETLSKARGVKKAIEIAERGID
ncbi:MAG: anthranilate synthase component I [Deltaproteobacteria bacterium]|nr:anthranilate synthase component I [Deltaproteobacteria bacterium]